MLLRTCLAVAPAPNFRATGLRTAVSRRRSRQYLERGA